MHKLWRRTAIRNEFMCGHEDLLLSTHISVILFSFSLELKIVMYSFDVELEYGLAVRCWAQKSSRKPLLLPQPRTGQACSLQYGPSVEIYYHLVLGER